MTVYSEKNIGVMGISRIGCIRHTGKVFSVLIWFKAKNFRLNGAGMK